MTIAKLHKLLGELIDGGNGRSQVYIDKGRAMHPLEFYGGFKLRVKAVRLEGQASAEDDSRSNSRKHRLETRLVLSGQGYLF